MKREGQTKNELRTNERSKATNKELDRKEGRKI
jgi:hypothetical protein